ncbi:hypothetical protein B0T25DRAFT_462744 [Lasiosphaeria hispida]|uniref:Uncharacterized protein n=1 Tax=Lasiosphaeria hispida TaxID=260671 RepID=A0AAJ0H9I9_9PEZI|nr:hypothetical protein B0T25DRAFT_462744 [Lasiosphaeria hispida]
MDGAAKRIDKVVKDILPRSPHHLTLSLDRKFPSPDGFWFTGASSPLQYMTFLSDAHRGILITRPSYEIRQEHESAPLLMPAKVLAKGEVKKKLSFKDYQNKKKSASPTDPEPLVKVDTRPNGTIAHTTKAPKEEGRKNDAKPKEKADSRQDPPRPDKPRQELNGEIIKSSQPRAPPETDNRKRTADTDGNPPPQKRIRSDNLTTKPDPLRARDRANEKPQREGRNESLHPTANGLAPSMAADRERENTTSPRSTIQVNGTRPRSESGMSTPRKPALPELLSPLHPSFDAELGQLSRPDTGRKKTASKAPPKPQKLEVPPPTTKRPKPALRLPPLLSPTLPPLIEAELARLKKLSTPKSETSQQSSQAPESPTSSRRTKAAADPAAEEAEPSRSSKIVTLKFKKANAKRVKDLLTLPSRSAKDTLRKERSMSVEGTPPPARKHPRLIALDDIPSEPLAAPKRTKLTGDSVVAKPVRPSTPLKQSATAMSRVTSSQSQGTPGNSTGLTPGTLERPPTRSDSVEPGRARANGESLRERHDEYRLMGTDLKHKRDAILRSKHQGATLSAADERRVTALHFEMILAYMVAFHSLNQARMLDRKMCDPAAWESLLPHLHELKRRVVNNRALRALALQMHAVCLEQITASFNTLNSAAVTTGFAQWAKLEKGRVPMWAEAVNVCDGVEDRRMKTLMGPWTRVEDAVAAVLGIMKRWADLDKVDWRPVIMKDRVGERATGRERERVNGARD